MYESFVYILNHGIGSGETIDYEWNGKQVGDGLYGIVTNENKEEYVRDVLLDIWREKEVQMKPMGKGFQRNITKEILTVLTPVSLGMLLNGEQIINV